MKAKGRLQWQLSSKNCKALPPNWRQTRLALCNLGCLLCYMHHLFPRQPSLLRSPPSSYLPRENWPTPFEVTAIECVLCHGHRMGSASRLPGMILLCSYGTRSLAITYLPITIILSVCMPWHGHPMESVWPLQVVIILYKYGMLSLLITG